MVSTDIQTASKQTQLRVGNVIGRLINTHIMALTYEGHEITMEDVAHSEKILENLIPNRPFYCMVEMPNLRHTSEETRRHLPHPNTRGVAVVYASPVGRMLGNAFLRLKGSMLPTRLFGTREQALSWLEELGPPKH